MKIKIAAGCQNESATNAVISAVGPREEPFIGKFYKISQCASHDSQFCMQYIQCMYLFPSV